MTNWQTIEMAPKDGEWVIAWNGEEVAPASWQDDSRDHGSGEFGWCYGEARYGGTLHEGINLMDPQPTRWMPLPAPPTR